MDRCQAGCLSKFDGRFLTKWKSVGWPEGGLSSDRLSAIMKDVHGDIWISTLDHGANKYNGESFTHFSVEEGIRSKDK